MNFKSQEFADFVGISKKSVQNYREEGMPSINKNSYHLFEFEAIQWLYDNGKKDVLGTGSQESEEQTPKYRKDLAEAKLKEHTLGIREKNYILVDTVNDEHFKIARTVRDNFLGLSNKVSPFLLNKSKVHEVKTIIDVEVNKILTLLVKMKI